MRSPIIHHQSFPAAASQNHRFLIFSQKPSLWEVLFVILKCIADIVQIVMVARQEYTISMVVL